MIRKIAAVLLLAVLLLTGSVTASRADEYSFSYFVYTNEDNQNGILQYCVCMVDELHLIVPPVLDGITIRELAQDCFSYQANLRSVVLPDSLEKIGDYAFAGNQSLLAIYIPSSVKDMGKDIFYECNERQLTVYVDPGTDSAAESYCRTSNLRYSYINEGILSFLMDEAQSPR